MKPFSILLGVLFCLALPSEAFAQRSPVEEVRGGNYELARQVLIGGNSAYPRAQMDSIGDVLVEMAVSASKRLLEGSVDPTSDRRTEEGALETLRSAAIGDGGTPYVGASQRMLRIALSGVPASAGAAYSLTVLADSTETLNLLRQVATANSVYGASAAVDLLAHNLRTLPDGMFALKDLYRQDLVVDPGAKRVIERLAVALGWRR